MAKKKAAKRSVPPKKVAKKKFVSPAEERKAFIALLRAEEKKVDTKINALEVAIDQLAGIDVADVEADNVINEAMDDLRTKVDDLEDISNALSVLLDRYEPAKK